MRSPKSGSHLAGVDAVKTAQLLLERSLTLTSAARRARKALLADPNPHVKVQRASTKRVRNAAKAMLAVVNSEVLPSYEELARFRRSARGSRGSSEVRAASAARDVDAQRFEAEALARAQRRDAAQLDAAALALAVESHASALAEAQHARMELLVRHTESTERLEQLEAVHVEKLAEFDAQKVVIAFHRTRDAELSQELLAAQAARTNLQGTLDAGVSRAAAREDAHAAQRIADRAAAARSREDAHAAHAALVASLRGAHALRVEAVEQRAYLDAASHAQHTAALEGGHSETLESMRGAVRERDERLAELGCVLALERAAREASDATALRQRAMAKAVKEAAESERVARIHANVLRMVSRMVGSDIRRRLMRWKAFVEMRRVEKREAVAAEHVRVAEVLRGEAEALATARETAARKSEELRSEAALVALQEELEASRVSVATRFNELCESEGLAGEVEALRAERGAALEELGASEHHVRGLRASIVEALARGATLRASVTEALAARDAARAVSVGLRSELADAAASARAAAEAHRKECERHAEERANMSVENVVAQHELRQLRKQLGGAG